MRKGVLYKLRLISLKNYGGGGKSLSRINNNIYIIKVLKGFISNLIK